MEETQGQLHPLGNAIRGSIKELGKLLKVQDRALAELMAAEKGGDLPGMARALARLDPGVLERVAPPPQADDLMAAAGERLGLMRSGQRRELARDLRAACAAAGREFAMLTENPPEFRLAPFTARVDTDRMEATLLYAREELDRSPARAPALMDAVQRAEKQLASHQLPLPDLFGMLLRAYRAALGASGRSPGERVELAEVLPQAALALQADRFCRDPQQTSFRSYARSRFLYDINRLRESRALEQAGLRLDLGTATGDSVRQKARVFYLEDSAGNGQYYLTLRFVPVHG